MENKKVIFDSNVYLGILNKDDSLYEKSMKVFKEKKDHIIIIPYSIVSEVTTLLTYRFSKQNANDFISYIKSSPNFFIVTNDMDTEILLFEEINSKIWFTDISLIAVSKKYNAELITFDKQLLQLFKKLS